jgi:hypothetical protein
MQHCAIEAALLQECTETAVEYCCARRARLDLSAFQTRPLAKRQGRMAKALVCRRALGVALQEYFGGRAEAIVARPFEQST